MCGSKFEQVGIGNLFRRFGPGWKVGDVVVIREEMKGGRASGTVIAYAETCERMRTKPSSVMEHVWTEGWSCAASQ